MDNYILSYSDWEAHKKEEFKRAYIFCKNKLRSPLTEEEFSNVWYSETTDKKGVDFLANMCMSIFQSRKSRAGKQFEVAIENKHKDLNILIYNQAWIDAEGNLHKKKPTTSCHKVDSIIPANSTTTHIKDMILISKKTTLRERYRQDLDFVGKCKKVIFLTKEIPDKTKIKTIAGYGCILVYPNAEDSEHVWSYEKYFSEIKKFQNLESDCSS